MRPYWAYECLMIGFLIRIMRNVVPIIGYMNEGGIDIVQE